MTSLRKQEKLENAVHQAFEDWRKGISEYMTRYKLTEKSEIPAHDFARKAHGHVTYEEFFRALAVEEENVKYYVKKALLSL